MDNQKGGKRSWLESFAHYVSGNSPRRLLVYLQISIEELATSLVRIFRLGGVISAQGLKSLWLIATAIVLALVYEAKKILRGLKDIITNTLKIIEIALISYTSEINPFWSGCAERAKAVVLSQSELNSMVQSYIQYLYELILAIPGKSKNTKKREILALVVTITQKTLLFIASILWSTIMSVMYLSVFVIPVYLFLRKRQFMAEVSGNRITALEDSMVHSGEGESDENYIEIESLINPLHQTGVRTTGDALIMKRGVLEGYEKLSKDTLLLRESQILIVRHEWKYVDDKPMKGIFYYFICIRDLGNGCCRSISNPFPSIQSATKLCESIFKKVKWIYKQN